VISEKRLAEMTRTQEVLSHLAIGWLLALFTGSILAFFVGMTTLAWFVGRWWGLAVWTVIVLTIAAFLYADDAGLLD
jgi:hypothetical protein